MWKFPSSVVVGRTTQRNNIITSWGTQACLSAGAHQLPLVPFSPPRSAPLARLLPRTIACGCAILTESLSLINLCQAREGVLVG